VKCPGCGAALSSAMVAKGECGYCGTALPKDPAAGTEDLAKAIERLADQPKVVHSTTIQVHAPDVHVGGLFDSLTAQIAGCFTGCLSIGVTVLITAMVLGFSAWQVWMQTRSVPHPSPAPHADHPKPDHPKPGKRRERDD